MRRNISNVLCVIGAPLFESTLAPRRSIAFRNSTGTWSRAPGKQFGVLDRWRDRHTRPARWSDTLRIRPVRWRKWNRIRIDLARLADPINLTTKTVKHSSAFQQEHGGHQQLIFTRTLELFNNLAMNCTNTHHISKSHWIRVEAPEYKFCHIFFNMSLCKPSFYHGCSF